MECPESDHRKHFVTNCVPFITETISEFINKSIGRKLNMFQPTCQDSSFPINEVLQRFCVLWYLQWNIFVVLVRQNKTFEDINLNSDFLMDLWHNEY